MPVGINGRDGKTEERNGGGMNATLRLHETAPAGRPDAVAVAGAAGAPLSNAQKRSLIMAAREAWLFQCKLGLWDEREEDSFGKFRHAAAWEACGVDSFCAMQQRHWLSALARFRELAARPGAERLAEPAGMPGASRTPSTSSRKPKRREMRK